VHDFAAAKDGGRRARPADGVWYDVKRGDQVKGHILVTGSTGIVGREVVRALRERDLPVRVARRSLQVEAVNYDGVHPVRLDFSEPATFREAVQGCRSMFLLRPTGVSGMRRTLNRLVDAARESGVSHIVFLSADGAGANLLIPHHAVEQHLRAGPRDWTILRGGVFAQNFATHYGRDIVERGCLYLPAGDGQVAFVDARDIGDLVAGIVAEPGVHLGRRYLLTGPAASSFEDAASWLSELLGRPIEYRPATAPGYLWHLRRGGLPLGQCAVQTALQVRLRGGRPARVDPALRELLGHRPRDLQEFLSDHAHLWRRPRA
jgi:uncharacterized protein YbjT (DUF2867 family)